MSTKSVQRNRQDADRELVAIDDIILTLEAIKQISAKLYSGNITAPHSAGAAVASSGDVRRGPSPMIHSSTGDDESGDVTAAAVFSGRDFAADEEQIGRLLPLDYPDRHEITRRIQALSTQKRKK